jgi:hypothetical protein
MTTHFFFKIIYKETKSNNIPLVIIIDSSLQFYWESPILMILIILTILVFHNLYYYDYNYKYSQTFNLLLYKFTLRPVISVHIIRVYYDTYFEISTQIIQRIHKVQHMYNFPFISYHLIMALL